MAVGANTYAEHEDVERLIGDIVLNREFGGTTTPTLVQVEAELDNQAADLNRELDQVGYTVPVVNADWPTAYAFLKAANAYGAAAVLLSTIPAEAYNPEDEIETGGEDRAKTYSIKFNHALKVIRESKLRASRRKARLADMFAGSQETEDGEEKLPIFTRGMDDYPGRRTLTGGDD